MAKVILGAVVGGVVGFIFSTITVGMWLQTQAINPQNWVFVTLGSAFLGAGPGAIVGALAGTTSAIVAAVRTQSLREPVARVG